MFACCDLCYEKYINSDGSIDEDRLLDLLIAAQGDKLHLKVCTCKCHVDGIAVRH